MFFHHIRFHIAGRIRKMRIYIHIYSFNHEYLKLFPTIVTFFDSETGIKIGILDFVSLSGETSQIIFDSISTI